MVKKNIEKPCVFDTFFWPVSPWPEDLTSKVCVLCEREKTFFPKHSVSPAREQSFQLLEFMDGPLCGWGRSGRTCALAKMVHPEFAKEFGISAKVLHFIVFFRHGSQKVVF